VSRPVFLILLTLFFCGCGGGGGGGGPVEAVNPSVPPGTNRLKQSESSTTSGGNAKSIKPSSGQ